MPLFSPRHLSSLLLLSVAPLWVAAQTEPAAVPAPAVAASAAAQAPAPEVIRPRVAGLQQLLGLPPVLPLAGNGPPMSLGEALQLAWQNSPDVAAARYRSLSFDYTRKAARGALLPKLETRASIGRGHFETPDATNNLGRADNSAVLSQALVDEAARHEWSRQELLAASAEVQLAGVESQTLLDTGTAWFAVLQQRVSVELGQTYEASLNELLRYIGDRVAAGGASPAERERITARVANVRSSLADSRAALAAALRNFQRLSSVAPFGLALDAPLDLELPIDPDAAMADAEVLNAEMLSSRLEQQAAESERKGSRAAFLPRLSVELSHSQTRNAAGTESNQRDSKAMLVMTLPLVNGGSDYARMHAAEARRNELEARGEAVRRRVLQDLETSYANLKAATERFASVRDELDANRKVVDAFRTQLTGGNRQLLDVLDAYQRLHQSRLDLVQVVVNAAQNEWRIAHLTGSLRTVVAR
ncbi:TolC family protein [Roseateles cellulosilyticus]|uniref:TolC family protein n=1 Tax=Pelomonas cellulosilytica TaxID=2906762 RepID=A0ABS8XRI1_9BURK|nr:TolC family protein [Pelomonas sp. P8]MCE4553512.1 TolC family protein [Pelomonas sp. P8]